MAIIPNDEKVFMADKTTRTDYGGSDALKSMQEWYTMQDIIQTVNNSGGGGGGVVTVGAGDGISIDTVDPANPVVFNTAMDQVVTITGSGSTTVTGTYPNFNIESTGGSADFSAVPEDILPLFDSVYDLGSESLQWYDLYLGNSLVIQGGVLTGNQYGLLTDTMLIGDLLLTSNTITPDASTAAQYLGSLGIIDVLGNIDASDGDWVNLPVVNVQGSAESGKSYVPGVINTTVDTWIHTYPDKLSFYSTNRDVMQALFDTLSQEDLSKATFKGSNDQFSMVTFGYDVLIPEEYNVIIEYGDPYWYVHVSRGTYPNGSADIISEFGDFQFLYLGFIEYPYSVTTEIKPIEKKPLTTGAEGQLRYNSKDANLELYSDSWKPIGLNLPDGVYIGTDDWASNSSVYKDLVENGLQASNFYYFDIYTAALPLPVFNVPPGTRKGQRIKIENRSDNIEVWLGGPYGGTFSVGYQALSVVWDGNQWIPFFS